LLALAAAEDYTVYQTDVVQAFLHDKLDYDDIFINPPASYQYLPGSSFSKPPRVLPRLL
jgi:hypothetical protein